MARSSFATKEDSAARPVEIEDVPILPNQFFRHRSQSSMPGERQLLLAILEEAVDCFCKTSGRTGRRNQRLYGEARDWIFSEDRSWFLSCQNICDVLEIDAEWLRERLLSWERNAAPDRPFGRVFPLSDHP